MYIKISSEKTDFTEKSNIIAENIINNFSNKRLFVEELNIHLLLPNGEWYLIVGKTKEELLETLGKSATEMFSSLITSAKEPNNLSVLESLPVMDKNFLLSFITSPIETYNTKAQKEELENITEIVPTTFKEYIDEVCYHLLKHYEQELIELKKDFLERSYQELSYLKAKIKYLEEQISSMSVFTNKESPKKEADTHYPEDLENYTFIKHPLVSITNKEDTIIYDDFRSALKDRKTLSSNVYHK